MLDGAGDGMIQSTFCPFDERYYDSPQALADHYREDFGFIPSSLPLENVDPVTLNGLTQQVETPLSLPYFLIFRLFKGGEEGGEL